MSLSIRVKGLFFAAAAGLLLATAAWAQEQSRDTEGLNPPDPENYFCQVANVEVGCTESAQCEAAVCAIDSFCCDTLWDGICVDEAQMFAECERPEESEPVARFLVQKFFDDGNPGEVEVTITCNTGLPLEQNAMISEGDDVNFVVGDFEDGAMDCEITETAGFDGYDQNYFDGVVSDDSSCTYEEVAFGTQNFCNISNSLLPSLFEVTKEWIDENPQFATQYIAEANFNCSNEQFFEVSGSLDFLGNPDTAGFQVFAHWDGTTTCTVSESVVEGGVEADDSDCQSVSVLVGEDASCTIVNTRLFEGIPTLGQYGLALMALLMLGVGFIAYRRFV